MPALFLARFTAILIAASTAAAFAADSALPKVADTIAERVRACTVCHGKEGRATSDGYYPRIAGKPAGYLYNQLANFRDGRRRNATMTNLVTNLPDANLRESAGSPISGSVSACRWRLSRGRVISPGFQRQVRPSSVPARSRSSDL